MAEDFFQEKYVITDMLLDGDMSKKEIAEYLKITPSELNKRIKSYNLDWVKVKKRKMSRGQASIVEILKKIIPNESIDFEYHVGERLLVDIYVPAFNLGIEYHGRQHFEYNAFFHGSKIDFELAQERDERKIELCKEQGITLVAFRYNDLLTEDSVFARILDAIKNAPPPIKKDEPEVDQEWIERKKEMLDRARKTKAKKRENYKAKGNVDHEERERKEQFKKQVKESRRKFRKDAYYSPPDDNWGIH